MLNKLNFCYYREKYDYGSRLKMEDEETPLRQKRGETTLMTIESASNRKTVKRSMTFGTSSIDVSDIQGFLYI